MRIRQLIGAMQSILDQEGDLLVFFEDSDSLGGSTDYYGEPAGTVIVHYGDFSDGEKVAFILLGEREYD